MAEPRRLALAAAVLFVLSVALFWPGLAMYDTVAQYGQVLSGDYDDWHPPVMARWWAVIGPGRGTAPMLVAQLAGWWLGLGLVAARIGHRAGWGVLALGIVPPFLAWEGVVLKDAQLAAALLAATGLVAWWRLAGRALPVLAVALVAVLLVYATLVRANAVFATVPLAVLLAPAPRGWSGRVAAVVVFMLVALAVAPAINHRLLGARPTGVERTQALYDLAGIAVRVGPGAADIGLRPGETRALIAKRCVRPFFWDPLGEETRCDADVERLRHVPVGTLYATLAGVIARHPLAYAGHRLAHLNSTERWLVPWRWPDAAPPPGSEPNDLGLGSPGRLAAGWMTLAGWIAETPVGWPVAWVVVGLAALGWAGRERSAVGGMALALLVSALCLEASFAVLSIASDLRYHLWPMLATALAVVLLASAGRPPRGVLAVGGAALVVVIAAGLAARATLPLPPQTYQGMLG